MKSDQKQTNNAGFSGVAKLALSAFKRHSIYEDEASALWKHRSPKSCSEADYLFHYARLAANAHNTQPWLFGRVGDAYVIKPDPARRTPVVDPDDHHLYCSLGCAAENLLLAANATGKAASVTFNPVGDGEIQIRLTSETPLKDPLFDAIIDRQCTRSDYSGQAVPNEHLKRLSDMAQLSGCELIVITDKPVIERVLELILSANSAQIGDPAFVKELTSWLRFNVASAIATRDGLYAPCSGNPTLPNWLSGPLFKMVFTAKSENIKCARQVRSSSGLAIFVSDKNDRENWIQSGRNYQRFALQATLLGIKHAFLNQPVEVPQFRQELATLLGTGERRPDFLVRFGYAEPMPRSLRRTVKQLMF